MTHSVLLPDRVNWMIDQQLPHRQSTLRMSLESLVRLHEPPYTIVECGTMRDDDWVSGGRSTQVFEEMVRAFGGQVVSLDVNSEACAYAASRTEPSLTKVVCCDAAAFLNREMHGPIHLLYLDAEDVDLTNPHPAATQTRRQLEAALDKLVPGALVLVDDSPQSDLFVPPWISDRERSQIRFPTGKGAQLLGHSALLLIAQAYQLLFQVPYSTQSIPRTIHHVFGLRDSELPDTWREWMEAWMELNPSFEHRLWNRDDCLRLVKAHDAAFIQHWQAMPNDLFVVLADYMRLLIVLNEGGFYLDCDIRPLMPIDPLVVAGVECILFREGAEGISNAAFAATAGHGVIERALHAVRDGIGVLLQQATVTNADILRLSGPTQIKQAAIDLGLFDPHARQGTPSRRDLYTATKRLYCRDGVLVCPVEAMVRCGCEHNWFGTHCANATWRPLGPNHDADLREDAVVWRRL